MKFWKLLLKKLQNLNKTAHFTSIELLLLDMTKISSFIQIMQSEVLFNVLFLNYKFISWPISDNKVNNPLEEHFSTLNLFIRFDLTLKMVDFEIKLPNFETK